MNERANSNGRNTDRILMITVLAVVALISLSASGAQSNAESTSDRNSRIWGYVFVDGHYVPPPYAIDLHDETLAINGYEFRERDLDLSEYDRELADKKKYFLERGWRRPDSITWTALGRLYDGVCLARLGDIVVLFRDRPPLILEWTRNGQELIKALTRPTKVRNGDACLPATLEFETDRATWALLVAEFQGSPAFLDRAANHLASFESVQRDNQNILARSLWADRIEYPLTVFSMVVVTLAFGHLLSTKPYEASHPADTVSTQPVVLRSLLFFCLLSFVDLVWTLLASQSTSMRELNPIGGGLIQDPIMLSLFKFSSTAIAVGLLYWLRWSIAAQFASWWCCLIVTLLTARWLMFQSMFM